MMRFLLPLTVLVAAPAAARDLPVPADKGWRHARTSLVLRPVLAGLRRESLKDNAADEFDVYAGYRSADGATVATIFVFQAHPADVALWFDRAEIALSTNARYGGVTPAAPTRAIDLPGVPGGGLQRVYTSASARERSTGVAALPVAGWIAVVRVTSATLKAAALDAELSRIVAAIGWPATTQKLPPARSILPCATSLRFAKARQKKPDMMQGLLGSVMAMTAARGEPSDAKPSTPFCRDGVARADWGVYRRTGAEADGYVLAIGDAGRSASVYKSFDAPQLPGGYGVNFHDLDGSTSTFPNFDRLPAPAQVMAAVTGGRALSRASGGSDGEIAVDPRSVR